MSHTENFVDIDSPNVADESRGGRGRHRRGLPNSLHHIPYKITHEAFFDQHTNNFISNDSILENVDLENGEIEDMVDLSGNNDEIECRICHLKDADGGDDDDNANDVLEYTNDSMRLGCDCKGDLGMAHRKCAITWFLIKGDLTCEICGTLAQNVFGMEQNVAFEQVHEVLHEDPEFQALEVSEPILEPESEGSSWNGHRFVDVLLGCMILAFLGSWLFHFSMVRLNKN